MGDQTSELDGLIDEFVTAIFALARTVGWIAQWNEMISDPEQKIGRPRQLYTGAKRRDVTPIARLTSEYEVIVVPASSPHKTMGDLVQAFKANPGSVSWGGGSAGVFTEVVDQERAVHTELMVLGSGETIGKLVETHEFTEQDNVTTMRITQAYESTEARDGAIASGMACMECPVQ